MLRMTLWCLMSVDECVKARDDLGRGRDSVEDVVVGKVEVYEVEWYM
jgi:hypothetical protein